MKLTRLVALTFGVILAAAAARADSASLSLTGTLVTSTDTFTLVFTVDGVGSQTVDLQTWSFGGGTNAAGNAITPGEFAFRFLRPLNRYPEFSSERRHSSVIVVETEYSLGW